MLSLQNGKIKSTSKRVGKKMACFDLPAGHTCPMADICHSRAIVDENRDYVRMDDYGQFRCYAASAEAQYPNVRAKRWSNYDRTAENTFVHDMVFEIKTTKVQSVRIHSSGDFYSWEYFYKWILIAMALPEVEFWGYTKQATFKKYLDDVSNVVPNFKLVYSQGGKLDDYAAKHSLNTCTVVSTPEDAVTQVRCNECPNDDYEAVMAGESFSLALHGTQPKGAKA